MKLAENKKWLACYFPSSWLTNLGHGMVVTVVGPTQPYLAKNVGVDIAIINLVWSFGFFGYMVGSLGTGFVFRKYCNNNFKKMLFLALTMIMNGAAMIVLPFVKNFGILVTFRFLQNVALGAFITADTSLIVYTLGPIKSRPFTMALHSVIGIGFLVATFLVLPFLPQELTSKDNNSICNSEVHVNETALESSTGNVNIPTDLILGINKINWPFIISGLWCIVSSIGFVILGCLPYKMPKFYSDEPSENQEGSNQLINSSATRIVHWKPLLVITFFYYFISCGIERIYQPMAYTYGLCGPLKLSPSDAVITDQSYNGGFMSGRIASIFVAQLIRPRNMILISLVVCIGAAAILVALGGVNVIALYAGTGILGFFVSWQFGSCYSWIAQKGDITGRLAPLFLIGCGAGSMVFPFVSGYVFTSAWGPNSILHLTLIVSTIQCGIYATMWMLSRKKVQQEIQLGSKL